MSVSLVKGCRRCCDGPFAPKLPVGFPPNAWDELGSFTWSAEDLAAEVAVRFGPEWSLDAAKDLSWDRRDVPSWRAYFSWDHLILVVHGRASYGDAWERREECWDDCHGDACMPHEHEMYHYVGASWILSADLVDTMHEVRDASQVAVLV